MSVDLSKIFTAEAKSSWEFLMTQGQACYVPAYQRPFSWGKDNVDRLLEDALHGLNLLGKRGNTISFLGTVIAIHDTKHVTVKPIFKGEMPPKVMTIIDGQQRISTFLMINIACHQLATKLIAKAAKKTDPYFSWLKDQVVEQQAALQGTLVMDTITGDPEHKFYPRLVRAYEDVWSKRGNQAEYNSPVSRLIWEYFLSITKSENGAFKYNPTDAAGHADKHYDAVADIFKYIVKRMAEITNKKAIEADFPELLGLTKSEIFSTALWGYVVPEEVQEFARDGADSVDYELFAQMLRFVVLSKYLNDRMAFTVVTAESEDDAFDMFEALNTTGEPLTAFETFKPKVIEAETMAKYENSPSFSSVNEIEQYLENFKKAEEKQKATSEMLVPFALAETGEKLQKRLVDQRRYLRDQFESDELVDLSAKRDFVARLADLAEFMRVVWKSPTGEDLSFRSGVKIDPETSVGFNVLRDLNHHIVVGPLSRFYGELRRAPTDEIQVKEKQLLEATRATVAFSVIWRAASGGTNNIDARYRSILAEKVDGKYGPLGVRPKDHTGAVSLSNYKRALVHFLDKEGIGEKEKWVRKVSRQPIYSQRIIARYVLFLAAHDAVSDKDNAGLVQRGRKDVQKLITPQHWHDKDYLTVEHVAPQRNSGAWSSELFDDPDTINKLGNLTLLPAAENSLLGNKSWEHKKALYRILSSEDQEAFNVHKDDCTKVGLSFSGKADDILAKSSYLPLCKSLGERDDEWSLEFINERSTRLAELAWDKLYPWLAID